MSLCPVTDGTKPEAGNAVVVAAMESSNGLCQQYTSSMFQDDNDPLVRVGIGNKSTEGLISLCDALNQGLPKAASMYLFHSTKNQSTLIRAKSSNNILDGPFDTYGSDKTLKKVDDDGIHDGSQVPWKCSYASLLRSIITSDLSAEKKEFAMLFQKSKVTPAHSQHSDFRDAVIQEDDLLSKSDGIENDSIENNGNMHSGNIPSAINTVSEIDPDLTTDVACTSDSTIMDSLVTSSNHGSIEALDEWTDPEFLEENILVEKLNQNIYDKEFYDNDHDIYVGKDKMLGPLCIAVMEKHMSTCCEAVVRGQFLSAYIKLRQEDLADILSEGEMEYFKNNQNNKNTPLLAVLKTYITFLEKEYPNIHSLTGHDSQLDASIENPEKADSKVLQLGSTQRLRKLVDSGLTYFRSKQNQNSVDSIRDAFRRLDLAMVRRAHFIDVPVNDGQQEKIQSILVNLLDLEKVGIDESDVLEYDTEMSFTKQMNNLDPEKRSWIIQELLESEKKYLRSLEQLEEINDSVQQEILETKALQAIRFEISMIFGNITEIYQKHAAFADCLKSRESDIDMCLGQILTDNLEEFSKPYYLYLSNRSKAIEIHQKLMSKSSKYKKMIMNIERLSGTDTEKVSISSLLIEPVQRIPRYTLLIDEILKLTPQDHVDRQHLYSAKDVANRIAGVHEGQEEITARVINNLITNVKNCPPTLLKNNRRLIAHIDANEIDILNGKVLRFVTLILFNDILVVIKRVSHSTSGKTILPTELTVGGYDDLSTKGSHCNTSYPDMVATRTSLNHSNRAEFRFKSCIQLTNVEVMVPKRSIDDPGRLDDIIYIRTIHTAIDDQEYFSSGCLRQYVLDSNRHCGQTFVRQMNEQRAASGVTGEDHSFILKKHVGASDVFFCIKTQQDYNLSTTKNSMALCFESPDEGNPDLVSSPTMLNDVGGLLIVQKNDNGTYRSTLSTPIQVSELIINPQENVARYLLTELLNGGRNSQRYQHAQFQRLMMKQLIFMDTALLSYQRRRTSGQDSRKLLELLIKRFGSKLQRSIPTSLLWNQSRSNVAVTTPSREPPQQKEVSDLLKSALEVTGQVESAVAMAPSVRIRRAQPLVTPMTYVWEVVPIYALTPPSPYQKRQWLKPSKHPVDKTREPDDSTFTDWNKIRVSNESNISLASQMSSMSSMSIRSRISTRNYISINLTGARSRHGAER